jgi:hypothetical protein
VCQQGVAQATADELLAEEAGSQVHTSSCKEGQEAERTACSEHAAIGADAGNPSSIGHLCVRLLCAELRTKAATARPVSQVPCQLRQGSVY